MVSMRDKLIASRQKAANLRPVPLAKADAGTRQFAEWAVGQHPGKSAPAAWTLDRNTYVQHVRNSVHIAIGAIARKMAMQEVMFYRRKVKKSGVHNEPLKWNHPIAELFREVNPRMTEWELWYYTEGWKLATGDSYWWKARNGFGTPKQIWPVPSQWVWAIPSPTEYVGSYRVESFFAMYGGRPAEVPASEIVQISEPNLDWSGNGRFYGSPPLVACANTVDIEQAMFTRLYHTFRNYAPPAVILATMERLTDSQLRQIYNQIVNQHSLAEHTGRPMILHSGLEPKYPGGSGGGVREMDYAKSLDATLTLTMAVFGTPRAVVGLVQDANRANMVGAMIAFAENVINPRLIQNAKNITYGIARDFEPDGSIIAKFPPCTVNDAEELRKAIETAGKSGAALTPNEIRETLFRKQPFVVGGDRPLMGGGMTEAFFGNDEAALEDAELQQQTGMPEQVGDDVNEMAAEVAKFEAIRKNRLAGAFNGNGVH